MSKTDTTTYVNVKRMGDGTWSVMTPAGIFTVTREDATSYMAEKIVGGIATDYIGMYDTRADAVAAIRTHTEMVMEGIA